ncbi:MAG: hypothetical protein J3Q66DRAFT_362907 [Benniella sp.]|nr:MAG: hypothetical protein J3Q66DRAFT_362907 [Benniella sp.]
MFDVANYFFFAKIATSMYEADEMDSKRLPVSVATDTQSPVCSYIHFNRTLDASFTLQAGSTSGVYMYVGPDKDLSLQLISKLLQARISDRTNKSLEDSSRFSRSATLERSVLSMKISMIVSETFVPSISEKMHLDWVLGDNEVSKLAGTLNEHQLSPPSGQYRQRWSSEHNYSQSSNLQQCVVRRTWSLPWRDS